VSAGQIVVEAMALLTLVAFLVHGKCTHREVVARRQSVIRDRPAPFDWTAEEAA
jgi:hypothetical protein